MTDTRIHENWVNWTALLAVSLLMWTGLIFMFGIALGTLKSPSDEAKARAYTAARYECPIIPRIPKGKSND